MAGRGWYATNYDQSSYFYFMNWVKITLVVLVAGWVQIGSAQRFSQDPSEFSAQAAMLIQSKKTEAAYQISGKFTTCWTSSWTEGQKSKIHFLAQEMGRRGHTSDTYFNFFTFLTYAVTQENLSSADMTKVLEVTEEVLRTRGRPEFARFAHNMNFFLARRYLAYTKVIQTQAKGGSYEFKVMNNDPNAYVAADGSLVKLDSIAAGDAFGAYQADETDTYEDPWKEDQYANLPKEEEAKEDDPWATQSNDDPWATYEDPWATPAEDNDPWAATAYADPWSNNEPLDPWAKPATTLQRPKVDPPIVHDYVADMRARYFFPPINGPVIELKGINVFINTPYDSMTVAGVDGHFLLAKGVFAGKGGNLKWPEVYDKMDGASVTLGEWHFEAENDFFWTPNATLTFAKFSNEPIEGRFEFRSKPRVPGSLSGYPVFQSNKAGLTLNISEKAKYTGGLEVRGSEFRGKAVSRELGQLELIGAKGNRVYINSPEFVLGDSAMTAETGELILIHGSDTIYHPAVQIWYDAATEEFIALRNKNRNASSFRSSYYGVELNVDILKWNMAKDSITLDVLNGKQEVPMTIESDKYYTPDRYTRLNSLFPTHPLVMVVHFSRKYGNINKFYDQELAVEYKEMIDVVRAELKILETYGLITYDRILGEVTVLPKAYHYFDAAAKKVDYDYLFIKSLSNDKPNAIMLLDSGKMVVNGVTSFSVVEGYDLEIETDSSKQVTLLKNKNFRVSGTITEGDFIYHGKDFEFNYDEFLIFMPTIDSMRLNVALHDSTAVESPESPVEKTELSNQLTGTSGTLYIEEPHHKAGHEDNDAYPYFVSDSEALVFFNGKEILNGAYDRSVFFVVPPFEVDSLDRDAGESFEFAGRFVSGGIFPEFDETLRIQPDRSLGFIHQIPPEGYNLYGTEARTYEKIRLSNQGIRGGGQIDFLTTQIFSDDFIYYPDSVTADGSGGRIKPGDYKGASFPEAILGKYDMRWLPRKDSMYLRTVNEPFKFYNATADLEGFANITTKGVYGGGVLKTRGSRSESKELNFKEKSYSARHAKFEIETADPEKPAMAADDISLNFDLVNNTAVLKPEQVGKASFSFPYAQMKTSITEAVWDLDKDLVTMTKPPNVPLKDSYFYSTRKELDSLVFSGERAIYDMKTNSITVEGIPYITVADSRIIPEGNTTTILENSELQEFRNAEIVIDTLNGYHHLTKGKITVISRNKFEGSAFYQVAVASDTFEIRFDTFFLRQVEVGKKKYRTMTVSGGEVPESQNLKIAPGFFYKGSVEMFAYKQALELEGQVKMDVKNISTLWIPYTRTDSSVNPHIPLINAVFEDGIQASAGIHNDAKGELYSTFVEKRKDPSDIDFFNAQGELMYDALNASYLVEAPAKAKGGLAGHLLQYNDANGDLFVEGPATFLKPTTTDIQIKAAVTGTGNKLTNEFALDCFLAMNYVVIDAIVDEMANDIVQALERIGANTANDPTDDLLVKLANIVGDQAALRYREKMLGGYESLLSTSSELAKSLVISGVKMKWNPALKAWHNTSKIGLSHIGRTDINAKVDGFLEIKRDDSNEDVMNLFIQVSPESWYFISYNNKNLLMYSSNATFNQLVESKSNLGKQKAGQLVFVVGDVNETLGFINAFRKNYFGIDTPYNLSFPSDANLDDENFDTIEKDDDGFGF
jgi:hypothetical protein